MKKNVESMLGYFSQIRRVYANEINLRFQNENFSPNEISILILLSNNESINTSSQLRLILGVSKGLVSRSIDQDPHDRRVRRIHLTQKAAPVILRLNKEIAEINEELLEDISEEEISQMERTMNKILERFKEKEN